MKQYKFSFIILYLTILSIIAPFPVLAETYNAANCELATVKALIADSKVRAGDVVAIPAGSCTWGVNKAYLSITKDITLQGAGRGQTIITLSDTAGSGTAATIRINAVATVKSMTINGSVTASTTPFSVGSKSGWRITDIDYNGGAASYFAFISEVYGLIDNNNITGGAGNAELIFIRGPADSWQTANSIGGADNVFIENNTFGGLGYVCDANSNARVVVRYNTITGPLKVDGHGLASNTPARGVRHMEIYNNTWTSMISNWRAMELRGGGGRIFNNNIMSAGNVYLLLTDYCYSAGSTYANCGKVCNCLTDYPVKDQIGVGIDPKSGGSEPMYLWGNIKNGSPVSITFTGTCKNPACDALNMSEVIKEGRDYFMSNTKPAAMAGYTPYPYPHPLTLTQTAPAPAPAVVNAPSALVPPPPPAPAPDVQPPPPVTKSWWRRLLRK